jgi:nitrous oxidase accessory protein
VTGKDLEPGMRGDAIRLWYSRHNVVEDNHFHRARDLTFANSADNRIAGNRFTDGRYGMHIIFSPRLRVENNRLAHTGTGIIVLYSPDLVLRGNHVAHALTDGGGGIVFKESGVALVENNEVLHCSVGLKVDAPPQSVGALTVSNNRFAHNVIGLFFYGEEGGHRFSGNRFENNLNTVAVSAPGAGGANVWRGNTWDDYQGFDRNNDGIGDTPHEVYLFADRIWMETPLAAFFRNSPVLEMLDFLERLAPFSSPHRVLRDPAPRMQLSLQSRFDNQGKLHETCLHHASAADRRVVSADFCRRCRSRPAGDQGPRRRQRPGPGLRRDQCRRACQAVDAGPCTEDPALRRRLRGSHAGSLQRADPLRQALCRRDRAHRAP